MADNEAASHEREQSLDFLSANFDPLQALYTKDLKPPIPSIQVFNNLFEYARIIKEGKPKTVPQKDPRKAASLRRAASKRTRNLKPEYKPPDISTRLKAIASTRVAQEDVLSGEKRVSVSGQDEDGLSKDKKQNALGFGRGRSGKKKYMNVLEKMEASATGPLSILYRCLDKRYKVQVWIRKYKGLRSVLTGYVIAFDKHMNLALMDVDEVYTTEEHHRQECRTEEDKTTKKKKKKKKKKRKPKSHLNQIKENLMEIDEKGIVSVEFTPPCDKINVKTVPELKENPILPANESTTAQDVGTGLSTVDDLNRPFKSLKSDYNRHQTVSKSSEGAKELMIMKDGETSSSLVTTKDCDKTEMLSADQLAALSKQWADEQEQKSKEALDSQQQIQTIDITEPTVDLDSEQTGYFFSHDLKVRVPAHEDMESQDVEFTVVGIFQPATPTMESNEDKSALLPENLEINVPLSFSNTVDKNEEMKDHTSELDKLVKPVITELVSHSAGNDGELRDHCLQVDNPVLPVSEPILQCIDIDSDAEDQLMQLDKPDVLVLKPVLHSINADGDSQDQVMVLDKPEVPVSEPVLQSIDTNGDSQDQVLQLDKPVVPVSEPVLHSMNTDGDSQDQVMHLDKPVVPVSEPVLHSLDTDGDSQDQVLELDKPELPVSEPVLHIKDIDEGAKDKVIQSDNVVTPTESILNVIELDGNTAQNDEIFAAETCFADEMPVICEGSSKEGESLRVCDFSDDITYKSNIESLTAVSCADDENSIICEGNSNEREISPNFSSLNQETPNIESLPAVSCANDENSIICGNSKEREISPNFSTLNQETPNIESLPAVSCANDENSIICGNSKEREISPNFSTLNQENPNIESFTAVHCVSKEKKIGERLLEELDVQVESEEDKPMYLREGTKNTEQNENEGSLIEDEDIKKTKEKCFTYEENENSWDDNNKYKEGSENIGKMKQGIEYCEEEGDKVERKDLSPASELVSMTSSKEQSVPVDNELTVLSRNEDSTVGESGVQDTPCENDVVEPIKGQKESWKQESLSRESKTAADSEDKEMEKNIGCVVAEPGGEDQPCKNKDADFHKGLEESSPCESLSSIKKNDAVAHPGEGDDPDGLEADLEESSPCESLSSIKKNDAVAHPGEGDDPDGLEADLEESSPCESLSSIKKNDAVAHPGEGDDPDRLEADLEESSPCESLSSIKKNDAVADPGEGDDPDGLEADLEESSPCESLLSIKKNDAVAHPGEGDDPDGLEADLEENSPCESLSSIKKNDDETRDERNGLQTKPKQSITGEPIQENKSEDSRSQLDGKDKEIEETETITQSSEGKTGGGVAESQQAEGEYDMKDKDDDKAMESEKEEGEITSSDEEEPTQPQVDQPKHGGTKNDQPKKLSVWERLGIKDKARKEESARRGGGDNYEKKRRDEKTQETRRNKDDEKKAKDQGRSTSGEHKRKEESGRKKEGKERKDMKTGERRGSVGSEKETRRDKDAGMRRRERLSTRAEDRDSVRSDIRPRKDKERKDERKKTQHRVVTGHMVKDDAEKPYHGAVSSTNQSRKEKESKMDGKTRERRPSSREEKEGQRKEGRGAFMAIARDEAETQRSKKDKEKKHSGESEKGPKISSTEIKKNEAKKMGSSSDVEKQARSKEKKSDEGKEPRLIKNETRKEERKERTVKPQGDRHSEKRSNTDTRHGMQARGESVDRKEKKGATSSRKPGEQPQGDQPTKIRSSDTKQLVLKEVSSNQKKQKEIIKEKKTIEISKPEKGVHRLTEQKKHRQPKGDVSKISDQPQGTQPRERRKADRLTDKSNQKVNKVNKTQETQSEKSSSRVGSELSRKEDQESRKGAKATKQIGADRLETTERDTISQRTSTCKKLAENLTSLENPKTEKTDVKQVKVGLLPTPVLEMNTRRSGTGRLTENNQRNIDASTVRARSTSSESSKIERNEKKGQKSSETFNKRKRSMENGRGTVKRQKRTEISGKNSPKPSIQREQFKDATRKKVQSDSEPEVKATTETTGSNSRLSVKDMGEEGRKAICTARRIEVGKGKYLEFKRRHVNQLFVRGDNIVMIGYAM